MFEGLLDILSHHGAFTCYVISTEGSIGPLSLCIIAVEITRNDLFKSVLICLVDVIVDYIHDDTQIGPVIGVNGVLEL